MFSTAIKIYKEFNPNKPLKSPRTKVLIKPSEDNYGIRWFNKKRFKDILSLVVIDKQSELVKKMLPKTPSKLKYYRDVLRSSENHQKYQFYVFAITNFNNEIIGWVQYTLDENVAKIKQQVKLEKKSLVFEVSYAKLFNQMYKRVGVNGLKQTMDIIRKIDNNVTRDVYITAYTDSDNIASEYVLNTNRFTKLAKQIIYEDEISNVWIKKIN